MSRRNLIARLKREAEKTVLKGEVEEISALMDELSAVAAGGTSSPVLTLAELMEASTNAQEPAR